MRTYQLTRLSRILALAFVLTYAPPVQAQQPQPEQVVIPTYTHESACYQTVPCASERTCYQTVPCAPTPPCLAPMTVTPCTPQAVPQPIIRYEMRSKALFWTGLGLAAGGATLVVASMTWQQTSVETTYVTLPCGTDPYFAQHTPIAGCEVNRPLLAAGLSLVGSGTVLMVYASQHVAVGTDGRQVTVRVRF